MLYMFCWFAASSTPLLCFALLLTACHRIRAIISRSL